MMVFADHVSDFARVDAAVKDLHLAVLKPRDVFILQHKRQILIGSFHGDSFL